MTKEKRYTSIGNQFALYIVVILLITLIVNAYLQFRHEQKLSIDELTTRADSIGQLMTFISVEPLLVFDTLTLNEYIRSTTHQTDVVYAIIVDSSGEALTSYLDNKNFYVARSIEAVSSASILELTDHISHNSNILTHAYPIVFDDVKLADIVLAMDKKPASNISFQTLIDQIIISLVLAIFVALALYIGFRNKVHIPVKNMREGLDKVTQFKFGEELKIGGNNELTELANSFNEMRVHLRDAVETRDRTLKEMEYLNRSLEERVKSRTSQLRALNDEITHQAMHDPLTNLPNRLLIIDRIDQAIQFARRNNSRIAVFIIDLNNFKDINDTLGHPEGDLILEQVANRIPMALRESDTVGRLGGDEFAVVLPNTSLRQALPVAQKIIDAIKPPFDLHNQPITIGASIGIAIYPEHGEEQSALIRHADVAMYESKRSDESFVVYDPESDNHTPKRLAMLADLHNAIDNDDLQLFYQPQVDLHSRKVIGVEALLRWKHPDIGMIPPDEFILIAENSGIINKLSEWVMAAAIKQWKTWHDQALDLTVAINMSSRNLIDPVMPHTLHQLLEAHDVPPHYIKLEITENTIMSNPDAVMKFISNKNLAGIRYAIDDFGTGYSSLSSLKKLSVDEVKIDKSFVMDMHVNEDDASIVRSVIDLAHNLGHIVIAEGVETVDALRMLQQLGCDVIQGYLLASPSPADSIPDMVDAINSSKLKALSSNNK